jgi:hypothetical protein
MRNAADGGRQLLEDARSLEEMVGLAPQLAYEALRAGAPAAPELERLAARSESRLVTAYARHGSAKAARDGAALLDAAEEFGTIGALRYAVEAASDAATAFLSEGRQDSATPRSPTVSSSRCGPSKRICTGACRSSGSTTAATSEPGDGVGRPWRRGAPNTSEADQIRSALRTTRGQSGETLSPVSQLSPRGLQRMRPETKGTP